MAAIRRLYNHVIIKKYVFSAVTPVSSTNKNDRHDITEILLEVALSTINHKPKYVTISGSMPGRFIFDD
jgi:hypothetical protein